MQREWLYCVFLSEIYVFIGDFFIKDCKMRSLRNGALRINAMCAVWFGMSGVL